MSELTIIELGDWRLAFNDRTLWRGELCSHIEHTGCAAETEEDRRCVLIADFLCEACKTAPPGVLLTLHKVHNLERVFTEEHLRRSLYSEVGTEEILRRLHARVCNETQAQEAKRA